VSLLDAIAGEKDAPRSATTPQPRKALPSNGTRGEKYARAALESESETVRNAGKGERNNTLNVAALKLGSLVPHLLSETEVRDALLEAARAAGLGEHESKATISSGLKAGMKEPRDLPPSQNNGSSGHDDHDWNPTDADAPDAPPRVAATTVATPPAPKFEIIDAAGIFAELEEPEYLVDQVARRGSLIQIVSYGGSGKSWLGVEMLVSVAAGKPWLGRFPTKAGAGLYLDWENGSYEMRRRFHAVAKARGLAVPVPGVALSAMPSVYMSDAGDFGRAVLEASAGRALVVVDTLKAANPGIDENDSNMRVGLDHLRRVGEQTGCTFVVLVHGKKISGSLSAIDPREQGRGSSAIFDAADSVFHVVYAPDEPLRVSQTKARMGRTVEPFLVSITDTESGGVLVSASDAPPGDTEDPAADFRKLCDAVLEVVKAHPGASGRIVRAQIKGSRAQATLAALEMLERHGAIRNTGGNGQRSAAKWFPTGKDMPKEDEWSDYDR
jgi:hypothetical protein